ncbi:MAG: FadR/GntR family transcriptional regulator, partial [Ignavibacteriales bacterium]|nr:FadR/GntR family transcriptional regulator [Ignavibacteriales bacterium]
LYIIHYMALPFVPVTGRGSLSQAVAVQIEEAIRSKVFTHGARLPSELELCEQFQVSRTAVREALRTMIAQGRITIVKGKGIFVRDLTAETVTGPIHRYFQLLGPRNYALDVIHARQIIEPPVAAFAAHCHTKEDAERIKKDFDDFVTCEGDYYEHIRLDVAFHLDIAKASENSLIPLVLEPIHQLMPQVKLSVYAAGVDSKELIVKGHRKILNAILRSDAKGARQAMTRHLQIAERQIKQMLKQPVGEKTTSLAVRSETNSTKRG